MAFKPDDDFKTLWTERTVADLRRNTLFYALGNNSGEADLRTYGEYKINDPTYNVTKTARNRNSSSGLLSDFGTTFSEPSLDFVTVKPQYNQNFATGLDQRDADRITALNIDSMRQDMLRQMRTWVDDTVSSAILGDFGETGGPPDANKTTAAGSFIGANAPTNNVAISRATGLPKAAGTGDVAAFTKSYFDWIKSLELKLALLNASPAIADGDSYDLVVVQCPQLYSMLYEYILDTYKNLDVLIREMLPQAMSILNGPQYQGTLFSRRLYTSGSTGLAAQGNTASGNTNGFRAYAIAVGEKASYDAALIDIGGVKYNPPDANSAKHKLRMEIELAYKTVEPNSMYEFAAGAVA